MGLNRGQNDDEMLFFPAETQFNQAQSLSSDVPPGRCRDGNSSGGSYASPHGTFADPVTGRKDSRRSGRKKRRRKPRSLKEMIYGIQEEAPASNYAQVFLDDEEFVDAKPKLDWPGALYLDLSSPGTPWYRRPSVVWFRGSDLKIEDNLALYAAVRRMAPLILVFVLEEDEEHKALEFYNADRSARRSPLEFRVESNEDTRREGIFNDVRSIQTAETQPSRIDTGSVPAEDSPRRIDVSNLISNGESSIWVRTEITTMSVVYRKKAQMLTPAISLLLGA